MSLLELLLVLFILSLLTLSVVTTVDDAVDQNRYEATRTRFSLFKDAVFSIAGQVQQGVPTFKGFVADVGRLPSSVDELLQRGNLPAYAFSENSGIHAGWNGPYLSSNFEQSGKRAFRDGWGNPGEAPNYGWVFEPNNRSGTLVVRSLGADWKAGGEGYAADYPVAPDPLLQRADYQLNLIGWSIQVEFVNSSNAALPLENELLRARVHYPKDGLLHWLNSWPITSMERDSTPGLSPVVNLEAGSVSAGQKITRVFSFDREAYVPCGNRSITIVRDSNGETLSSGSRPHVVSLIPRVQPPTISLVWHLSQ